MISQTTEYALRAIVWLAARPGESIGTDKIAKAVCVPAGYLSKVLQTLANGGFVISRPGRSGGFQLNRSADELSILEVINAINPIQRVERCPLGREGHEDLCPLHRTIDEAAEFVQQRFAEMTIADLLSGTPGCEALPGNRNECETCPENGVG